ERESFVAAKVKDRVIAPFCYKGTCNTKLFNLWLENLLIPLLTPGKIDWYGPLSSLQTSPNQHLQRFIKGQSIDEVESIKVVSA
ncbi:MAG: hypothetical protein Q8S31_03185, partial [Alphaproteobacteria bacterium]|nr:hypothetical protein [Alphaproteobacteria bacterium]